MTSNKLRRGRIFLEGLRIALKYLDEIIALIRGSADTDQARIKLIKKFKLSEIQANAILDMPLKRLAALERKKIEEEYKELMTRIKALEGLLRSARKLREVVAEELQEVKKKFNDRRRTQIVFLKKGEANHLKLTLSDLTEAAETWVQISSDGLISRKNSPTLPKYSGRNAPILVLKADTHQTLYLVGKDGMASALAIHTLPEADRLDEGTMLEKATPFKDAKKLALGFVVQKEDRVLYQRILSPSPNREWSRRAYSAIYQGLLRRCSRWSRSTREMKCKKCFSPEVIMI